VEKRDARAVASGARATVDQLEASLGRARERGVDVLDVKREVVDAFAPFLEEARDRGFSGSRLEKLDHGVAPFEEGQAKVHGLEQFGALEREAELRPRYDGRLENAHSDPDVREAEDRLGHGAADGGTPP